MKIERDTPDQLILTHLRWKIPALWAGVTLGGLGVAAVIVRTAPLPFFEFAVLLGLLVAMPLVLAQYHVEKVQLILNRPAGMAELRRADRSGYARHRFDLADIQGTRVLRRPSARGAAAEDPRRRLVLYVRNGMDQGRYPLSRWALDAQTALDVSARVNRWMRPVRQDLSAACRAHATGLTARPAPGSMET